ncbi:3-hydroxy-2-methylbutyryl-CoA dehydrogenase [Cupriavidus sp. SHE]|jgi:NAD(P)-dependent dehydrogenase (short-subunit alcohol dehydrogenase family)|uniref:SDR family NAD(P)-dependent oxidoreductase n=1 Tax=Cupriavidus metallidurans TaxID=119219 RepID=A0A482IRY1_9BURK|nr:MULTISPECIES: SDR family NAD(P)-dependent oxidoreductase [Cupriavidus]KWR76286.1 3-hydroxy-2-methylbutyryl-CoA dehydrogenase [Cupriavidus sp. SHE]QBP11825.1 SDR family NAD(P)-dependent oxidoreductase [Cupriavidus metallidurans]
MKLDKTMSAVVTGGASGLGLASARRLVERGVKVVIADVSEERGAIALDDLGGQATFVQADVTDTEQMTRVFDAAVALAPLRALVHCAGLGGPVRVVEKDGSPGSLETYERVVRINLIGTFNALRLASARMATNEPVDGERGASVLTASVAAYEGQIGQIPYASAKAGIVGMTLVAARDLAQRMIRVCTIAPGLFDTPLLARLPEHVKTALGASVPHPARLGAPDEYASTALHILENAMLNGETIRLDGAIRMAAR